MINPGTADASLICKGATKERLKESQLEGCSTECQPSEKGKLHRLSNLGQQMQGTKSLNHSWLSGSYQGA